MAENKLCISVPKMSNLRVLIRQIQDQEQQRAGTRPTAAWVIRLCVLHETVTRGLDPGIQPDRGVT